MSYLSDIEQEIRVIKDKADDQPNIAIDMLADIVLRLAQRIEE